MRLSNNLENNILSSIYLKQLANMWENSGSQFSRATIGIQSEPDALDERRAVMTFLIVFSVEI